MVQAFNYKRASLAFFLGIWMIPLSSSACPPKWGRRVEWMELKLIEVLSAEPLEKFKSWVLNGDTSIMAVITPSKQSSGGLACGKTAQSVHLLALVLSLVLDSSPQTPCLSFTSLSSLKCPASVDVVWIYLQSLHFIHLKTSFCKISEMIMRSSWHYTWCKPLQILSVSSPCVL